MSDLEVLFSIIGGLVLIYLIGSYIKRRNSDKDPGPIMSDPLPPTPSEFRKNKRMK